MSRVRWDGARAVVVPGRDRIHRPALDRFLEKLVALDEEQGGCWIWLGAKDPAGYARFHVTRVIGKAYAEKAYRWAYEHWNGPIPHGMHLHHVCEVPACVNPDHLRVLAPGEHTLIGRSASALNAVKTHCKRGHAFDEANTYWVNGGRYRSCRACRASARRQRWGAS